ncbi:unnamed protein product [marine sediment metagenome]|uniref:Uncharacterized protein n=1 Tax=marine sediment metagenome TaxID=412755 RepID=X1BYF8_9ZZZZ
MPASFRGYVVPGGVLDKCSKCGQLVWVSPSSLLIMHDNPGMDILCTLCSLTKIKKDKEFEIADITLAQAEEFEEYLDSEEPVE